MFLAHRVIAVRLMMSVRFKDEGGDAESCGLERAERRAFRGQFDSHLNQSFRSVRDEHSRLAHNLDISGLLVCVLGTLDVCGSLPQEFGGAPPFSPNLYYLSPSAHHPLHRISRDLNIFLSLL